MSLEVYENDDVLPPDRRGGLWLAGNFDGVHKGHQAIIAAMREVEANLGVITFDPHPRRYFFPDQPFLQLTDPAEKARRLAACGVRRLLVCRFDAGLASMPARDFIERIILARCGATGIGVGADFRFGAGRQGDVALLRAVMGDAAVRVLAPVCDDIGQPYSSSRVRAALTAGDAALAAQLLGWPVPAKGAKNPSS